MRASSCPSKTQHIHPKPEETPSWIIFVNAIMLAEPKTPIAAQLITDLLTLGLPTSLSGCRPPDCHRANYVLGISAHPSVSDANDGQH